jgi:spermidine synthase
MRGRRLFLFLYSASGAAALVYEIAWTRLLTLLMGQTVAAASTALAAIMGGLALGSWIGGRAQARWTPDTTRTRALATYAALELFVALTALALPLLLAAATPALAWAYGDGHAAMRFGVMRAALALLLVGIPATAMGATFPIAVAASARSASDAGLLYAFNTAGAAIGSILTGFVLLPAAGIRMTTWIGVALNVLAAAGAQWLARTPAATPLDEPATRTVASAREKPRRSKAPAARGTAPSLAPAPRLAAAAAAASGFCALIYEVIWTRIAALVIGPTTYAFATVVASFIVGLAIGSAVAARWLPRITRPAAWLGATLAIAAVGASAAGWFAASQLPLVVAGQVAAPDAAFVSIVSRQAIGTALLLLPMTLALGAAFPLALATASATAADVGSVSARVYGANTVGAIAGSLVGGFVLLPALGLQTSLRATAVLGLIAAAAVWAADSVGSERRVRAWTWRGAMIAAATIVLIVLPAWSPQLLAGGAYKYAPYLGVADLENDLRTWKLEYLEDGPTATVSVRELAGQRSLVINGKVDASNMGDMLTQRLLGLLPVLMHAHAERVLVLGLGSGVTAASVLAPGTTRALDVVEISPEVVKASDLFRRENGDVLRRPAVNLIVGDGRSHLALGAERYDVIVSEPSNPWMAGIAALFTREFFETARARLRPDGIVCQWAHTYDISAGDLKSIVRTFTAVFPESTMWLVGDGDLLLIGTNGPSIQSHLDGFAARARQGSTASLLRDVDVREQYIPFLLMSLLAGGPSQMRAYGGDAALQNDDTMALEFSGPRAIYGRSNEDNAAEIRQMAAHGPSIAAARSEWDRADDAAWAAAGAMELKADAYTAAYDRYLRALKINASNAEALAGLSDAAAGARRTNDAREWLETRARTDPSNANVRLELSRLLAATGDMERAATLASEAIRLAPGDERAALQLAAVCADAGDGKRLAAIADALVSRFPALDRARVYRAQAMFLNGDTARAVADMRQFVAAHPDVVQAQNLLGVACATSGDRDCASRAFDAALKLNPRDAQTYVNLGVLHMQSADPAAAAEYFATAATLDRTSTAARQGLEEARAAMARSGS